MMLIGSVGAGQRANLMSPGSLSRAAVSVKEAPDEKRIQRAPGEDP
jgi:hypothetical protein